MCIPQILHILHCDCFSLENGPNTTVGIDGLPMKNHPNFSSKKAKVISENWEVIKNGIINIFKEIN